MTLKTEEYLKKIIVTKKKWLQATEEVESKAKEVPSPLIKKSQNETPKP